jgi:hypothetical protein
MGVVDRRSTTVARRSNGSPYRHRKKLAVSGEESDRMYSTPDSEIDTAPRSAVSRGRAATHAMRDLTRPGL